MSGRCIGRCGNCDLPMSQSDCTVEEIKGLYTKVCTCPRCKEKNMAVDKVKPKKKWNGSPPDKCDLCHQPMGEHFYDASIPRARGSWGKICSTCFHDNGCRLGEGCGQKYDTITLEKVDG
jgi:hypothetical protein